MPPTTRARMTPLLVVSQPNQIKLTQVGCVIVTLQLPTRSHWGKLKFG